MFIKYQIATSTDDSNWTLWRMGTFYAIKHPAGNCYTGSAKYIQRLWNERFAGLGAKVYTLA